MKKTLIAVSFLCSVFATVKQEAALPPFYQSVNEIKAILSHEELTSLELSGELLLGIQRTEKGYLIETTDHWVAVDVVYVPTSRIGPVDFEIHFYPAILKNVYREKPQV